jgi:hypothetical protein
LAVTVAKAESLMVVGVSRIGIPGFKCVRMAEKSASSAAAS